MGSTDTAVGCIDIFQSEHAVSVPAGPSVLTYDRRSAVLVRLEDGAGRVGWGEAYQRPGVFAILDELARYILGREPGDYLRLVDGLSARSPDRWAVSAVAIALDDLRARQLGLPVASLYGGRRRGSVRVYASSMGYRDDMPPEQSWQAELESALADGFRAAKFRVGRHTLGREVPILERLRSAAGPDFDLMVDANGAYAVPTALRMGRALEDLQFRWFEEPLTRYQAGLVYPGYEQLASLDIAVAAAEGLDTRSAFEAFLARGAADIIQPDAAICGGIGEALFVAELAALRGRLCVPHTFGGAILLAATLQLIAVMREPAEIAGADSPLLEVDRSENPLRTELWGGEVKPVDGVIEIPGGPGLGIVIDDDFVRRTANITRRHAAADM
jgi:D-galactarolactone cycloisomerase